MPGDLPIVLGFAWAAIVAALIFRAWRQFGAWRAAELAGPAAGGRLPPVAVIVPARNEGDVIGRCLAALVAQDYPPARRRLIVVDDNSVDDTAAIVAAAARQAAVELVSAGPLPAGWTGKSHACWRGRAAAGEAEFLCFIDADVVPAPALLRAAVGEALRRRVDLLSLEPRQELVTLWERLVIPAGLFVLAFLRDFRSLNDPASPQAAANGQFILIRRAVYDRIGGHAAVRDAICEDRALAQAAKDAGCSVALLGAATLARTRMYRNLPALWEGLRKNSTETLGGVAPALAAIACAAPLSWASLFVPLAAVLHWGAAPESALAFAALLLALSASLALFCLHAEGARYLGVPRRYGLLFPLGYVLAAAIACDGLRQHWRGSTVWKGRRYPTLGES